MTIVDISKFLMEDRKKKFRRPHWEDMFFVTSTEAILGVPRLGLYSQAGLLAPVWIDLESLSADDWEEVGS